MARSLSAAGPALAKPCHSPNSQPFSKKIRLEWNPSTTYTKKQSEMRSKCETAAIAIAHELKLRDPGRFLAIRVAVIQGGVHVNPSMYEDARNHLLVRYSNARGRKLGSVHIIYNDETESFDLQETTIEYWASNSFVQQKVFNL
ncbi:uncharacterized protein FOMMEDRAFT_137207 [Fomitiporia mediterranea MF3/22]|uniref:uncharacterized protein n=1 Tax=Fomitiporia mediterranea (strain MF3/22) TaxID=694068 RepID=UPI0004408B3D|nr:uncharacterized protein FOMMEDRAFT_137207 [Fomitiporia mediterranea MF3/22]EJC98327.1 hypothetical protein FOMMEDRAFT_137207 [Fomitiporia mediterranea MF3/22]